MIEWHFLKAVWIKFTYIYKELTSRQSDNMTKQLQLLLLTIHFGIIAQLGQAQHVVKGRVLNKEGDAIPKCNVFVKGESVWTDSDFDGYFELTVPKPNDTLVFAFIGLVSKEVPL